MMKAGCIFNMEEWNEAYQIYKVLLADDNTSYTLLYYCGRCLYETGRYSLAYDHFMDALAMLMLDTDVPQEMFTELYYYLADSAYMTGSTEQAKSFLYQGLALDPDDEDLKRIAAKILPEQ